MKKRVYACALIGLLLIGISLLNFRKSNRAVPPPPVDDILRAYNVAQVANGLAAFSVEARELVYHRAAPGSELSVFYEQYVMVSTDGSIYRRSKVDQLRSREQIDFVGGQVAYRSTIKNGKQVGPPTRLFNSESVSVQSAIYMFGIIPILKQLQGADIEAVYLGPAGENRGMVSVKTAYDDWILYVDAGRLIHRIQMTRDHHNVTIDYTNYRVVNGVQIPFVQHVFVDGVLLYELRFTRIDLNPWFPEGHFSIDSLANIA